MRRLFCLAATLLLSCSPTAEVSKTSPYDGLDLSSVSQMNSFALAPGSVSTRSNAEIANDFMDLEFRLESGRILPVFTRFEGVISVAMRGDVPPTAASDLQKLMLRLRAEAGLQIEPAADDSPARISIDFLPRARMQAVVPTAACFVAPGVSSWTEYRKQRRSEALDWVKMTRRDRLAIFVPSDTSPQEVRDCLHEELAQALGPLNDLYRLPDSVFNDDNFHAVLTGFDMLILRLHYHPELRNGMTEAEVVARLPAILSRINPAGQYAGQIHSGTGPRRWIDHVETALGPKTTDASRVRAAEAALSLAQQQRWTDARLAFSHFVVGRLNLGKDTLRAAASLQMAAQIYRTLPSGAVHEAHVDMQLAAFALSSGQPEITIRLADKSFAVVKRAENAALLATFMLLKAQALEQLGYIAEADRLRLDSLGWARYGFGGADQVRSRMADIAALSPPRLGG